MRRRCRYLCEYLFIKKKVSQRNSPTKLKAKILLQNWQQSDHPLPLRIRSLHQYQLRWMTQCMLHFFFFFFTLLTKFYLNYKTRKKKKEEKRKKKREARNVINIIFCFYFSQHTIFLFKNKKQEIENIKWKHYQSNSKFSNL